MSRLVRPDASLNAMNDERDHLAIQISLLSDAETPDLMLLARMRERLAVLERSISHYKPALS